MHELPRYFLSRSCCARGRERAFGWTLALKCNPIAHHPCPTLDIES